MEIKKVLIITYYWPPAGGPGVQRWLKMAKYLIKKGIEVHVLAPHPEKANYPIRDESLAELDPKSYHLHLTDNFDVFNLIKKVKPKAEYPYSGFSNKSTPSFAQKILRFVRSHAFIPDPRKGWNKYAYTKAKSIIDDHNIINVITTSPPHSTQLIGLKLKRNFPKINWIADFRDPWTDIYYYNDFYHSRLSKKIDLSYERKVFNHCDFLSVVSKSSKTMFAEKHSLELDKIKVHCNGYDHEEFKSTMSTYKTDKYTICYTGTLGDSYNIETLINVIYTSLSQYHDKIRVELVGNIANKYITIINELDTNNITSLRGHVPHSEAISYMQNSNLLLLLIPQIENNKYLIPGKVFEYIATKRPILCLGPTNGDPANIINETKSGKAFDYQDHEGLTNFLLEEFTKWNNNTEPTLAQSNPEQYTRLNIANKFIPLLK